MTHLLIPIADIQRRIDEIKGYGVYSDEFDAREEGWLQALLKDEQQIDLSDDGIHAFAKVGSDKHYSSLIEAGDRADIIYATYLQALKDLL